MDEELEELEDTLPEGDEEISAEADVDEDGDEAPTESESDGGEPDALEPDGDVYAEVEYEKDGELYRYDVPKDVVDAIRAAERERFESRRSQHQAQIHPSVARSELRSVVETWLEQGHTDEAIMKAVAEFYYGENNRKAEEPDAPLPENATIEEEIGYHVAKQLKPLQKKVEEYENLLRRQEEERSGELMWAANNALFEAELQARDLPLTINPKAGAVMRSIIQEMTDNAPLNRYKLNQRQVRAILDQFSEEMMADEDFDDKTPTYSTARVAYRGRAERPQPKQQQQKTPQKKAPQILSGRTVRNASFRTQEPEKPKTPRDSMELLRSL